MPTVVLADDEEFVRYFIKSIMESIYYEVVAEVESGDELVNVMHQQSPDILLLDINMPNLTGAEFLRDHAGNFPNTCIIILTSSSKIPILRATETAAKCFLRKDTPLEEMVEAIETTWANFKKGK